MVVVQNQGVGFEDLRWEVRGKQNKRSQVRELQWWLRGDHVWDVMWTKRWTLMSLLKVS